MYPVEVKPDNSYCETCLTSCVLGFVQLVIGAQLVVIIMYWMQNTVENLHVIVCSVGFQFFTIQAILCLNYANGWSMPLKLSHRNYMHALLQICSIICVVFGTVAVAKTKSLSGSNHSLTGLLAVGFAMATTILGPGSLFAGSSWKVAHTTLGIPTFILASVNYCYGLSLPAFLEFAGPLLPNVMIGFVIFYTVVIALMCFVKYMMRLYLSCLENRSSR